MKQLYNIVNEQETQFALNATKVSLFGGKTNKMVQSSGDVLDIQNAITLNQIFTFKTDIFILTLLINTLQLTK